MNPAASSPPSWYYYVQGVGIMCSLLIASYTLWRNTAAQKLTCLLAITTNHRTIWSQVITDNTLERVLSSTVDLRAAPMTLKERLFVTQLIMHLQASFYAQDASVIDSVEGMYQDVGDFFRLPIPADVWNTIRGFQN